MSRKLSAAALGVLDIALTGILVPERGGFWRHYSASSEAWGRLDLPNVTQTVRSLLKRGYLLELPHIGPGCFPSFEMSRHSKAVEITFNGSIALMEGKKS